MKECELCSAPARMYCESDQASLCWDCDSKVHCANFLVARHSRSLLCHSCQSVTPWQATGAKLGPTVSVCERCMKGKERGGGVAEEKSHGGNEIDRDDDDDDGGDSDGDGDDDSSSSSSGGGGSGSDGGDVNLDDDDDGDEDEDGDGENQVVPLSSTPPPPIASCSSSEESSSRFCNSFLPRDSHSLKRLRENADLASQQDDLCCASSSHHSDDEEEEEEATSFASIRPLKNRKRALILTTTTTSSEADSCSSSSDDESTTTPPPPSSILHFCKLSRDPSTAVDLISSSSDRPI
ncbi:hypothetical protein Scep_013222 [Stephania cephalantha]|uniref:B box-type domain-containing protein n=1 Tax=Stephania cephalantha TaxID=152367 RepID=A0AAP0JGN3_9MAGN